MKPIDMVRLKQLTGGKVPLNPFGSCFDATGHQFVYWQREDQDAPKNMFIVHGIGVANVPGQEGSKMCHAWLEWHCSQTGIQMAYDCLWHIRVPAREYRRQLKVSFSVKYSFTDFFLLWSEHDFPGPWHPKLKEVIGDK